MIKVHWKLMLPVFVEIKDRVPGTKRNPDRALQRNLENILSRERERETERIVTISIIRQGRKEQEN